MSDLAQKAKDALDESRLLILVVQVFIGFHFRAPFEGRFEALPPSYQLADLVALGLLLAALILLIAPAPFYELAYRGAASTAMQGFASRMTGAGLLPFLVAVAISLLVTTSTVEGTVVAALLAAAFGALAFWFCYGRPLRDRRGRAPRRDVMEQPSVHDRIQQMLTEARMILPGAQALLGFQFSTFLSAEFQKLPAAAKHLHVVSLSLIALSTIFLMAPAAYHRLAEYGADSERAVSFGVRMVVAALLPLVAGVAVDLYVVVGRVTGSPRAAMICSGGVLLAATILWFVYPMVRRRRRATA